VPTKQLRQWVKFMSDDKKKSISQLEGWSWNTDIPAKDNSSFEEYNFYLLHNKPIKNYSLEDVYFMIGQESGLKYLVPIAIEYLSNAPLLKADDYPGDLLGRVLLIKKDFWGSFPEHHKALLRIIKKDNLPLPSPEVTDDVNKFLDRSIKSFLVA
jgi:hypothetical protein